MNGGAPMPGSSHVAGPRSPERSPSGPATAFVLTAAFAVFVLQLDIWAARQGLLPGPPIAFLGAFAIATAIAVSRRPPARAGGAGLLGWLEAGAPFWGALLAYVAWGWLRAGLSLDPIYDLRLALLPGVDCLVILTGALAGSLRPLRRSWRGVAALAFGLLLASLLVDGWLPGTFSKQVSRAAGFAGNPNEGGLRLVLLAAASLGYLRPRLRDLVILAGCGLGVFLTLSRGALVLFALLGVVYGACLLLTAPWPRSRRTWIALVLGSLGLTAVLAFAGFRWLPALPQFDTEHGQQRLSLLASFGGFIQGAEGTRVQVLRDSLDEIAGRPLLGYGLGYSSTMNPGPHNQFLKIWLDEGAVGAGLSVLVLLGAAAVFLSRRSSTGLVFVALVAGKAFFSHNLIDDRTVLLLLGLLMSVSLGSGGGMEGREISAQRKSEIFEGMKPNTRGGA